MIPYMNLGGNSGVKAYKINDESIIVEFSTGSAYLYDYSKPGQTHVEEMKILANRGIGLNSYIGRMVKKNYAAKLR